MLAHYESIFGYIQFGPACGSQAWLAVRALEFSTSLSNLSNVSLQCINIIFHLYFSLFSSRLRSRRRRPSILHPSLFSNPKKSFHLPIHAEAMAHAFITDLATPKAFPQFAGDLRILEYLNLFAIVGEVSEELSSDASNDQLSYSSHSALGSTSGSHLHRDCSESSASDFAD
jgi:hypothetical protein